MEEKVKAIPIRTMIIILFLILTLLFISIYTSLATFKKSYEQKDVAVIKVKDITPEIETTDESFELNTDKHNGVVTIGPSERKFIKLTIRNDENINVLYKMYYENSNENVEVGVTKRYDVNTNGKLVGKTIGAVEETQESDTDSYNLVVGVINKSEQEESITIGVQGGYETNEVKLEEGRKELGQVDEYLEEATVNDNIIQTQEPDFTETSIDKGLFKLKGDIATEEDITKDIYYYRGAVTNNFVEFGTYVSDVHNNIYDSSTKNSSDEIVAKQGSPILWRIVRVNEDRSIKLIAEHNIGLPVAWNSVNNTDYETKNEDGSTTDSLIKQTIDKWYDETFINPTEGYEENKKLDSFVEDTKFCNDSTVVSRLDVDIPKPTLKCADENDIVTAKAGLITADEMAYAGVLNSPKSSMPDNIPYINNSTYFWTISPISSASMFYWSPAVLRHGAGGRPVTDSTLSAARTVITIKANLIVDSGIGTESSPYKLLIPEI